MVQLKYRWDPERVLFVSETASTVREAVVEAVAKKADLGGAYLGGADLGGADLGGADLRWAYLGGADLGGAYLRWADLRWADLRGAYLRGAYLGGADLGGADLGGAYLRWADLGGADLRGAKINWQSHDAIAEILRREAAEDTEKRKVAGLVVVSRDWCWKSFLAIESSLRDWALDTLAGYVVDGDGAPDVLVERKRKSDATKGETSD